MVDKFLQYNTVSRVLFSIINKIVVIIVFIIVIVIIIVSMLRL